jgi:ribosomal protein L11 methyltransferase
MRELRLRVPAAAVEDVLDRLLPLVPGGVREVPCGDEAELKLRGADLPAVAEVVRAAGRWRYQISEATVPDDWRERRLLDYRPDMIGGRVLVRPEWAPAAPPPMLDIVLADLRAFGAGTHPTTRTCLQQLLELEPGGSFADLGCGSGVLAILAARLGWAPVMALDLQPESLAAVRVNAAANGVAIEMQVADLSAEAPPPADGIAANVPSALHRVIASSLVEPLPRTALVSGFGPGEADAVLSAYAGRGLHQDRTIELHGWVVALLSRD